MKTRQQELDEIEAAIAAPLAPATSREALVMLAATRIADVGHMVNRHKYGIGRGQATKRQVALATQVAEKLMTQVEGHYIAAQMDLQHAVLDRAVRKLLGTYLGTFYTNPPEVPGQKRW